MVTAGSDAKCQKGLENGADCAVNYETEDWCDFAKQFAQKKGLDIIVDHVGLNTLPHTQNHNLFPFDVHSKVLFS